MAVGKPRVVSVFASLRNSPMVLFHTEGSRADTFSLFCSEGPRKILHSQTMVTDILPFHYQGTIGLVKRVNLVNYNFLYLNIVVTIYNLSEFHNFNKFSCYRF